MIRRLLLAVSMLVPQVASAQFLPNRGPSNEQSEMAAVLLLGPGAAGLGAFAGGAPVFLVTRECCTKGKDSDDVDFVPVAIGAGIGAALASAYAVRSISNPVHPGSERNLVLGAFAGAAAGTTALLAGPEVEDANDQALRVLAFLLLPPLAAYAGFHVDPGGGYYFERSAIWQRHVGPERERSRPVMTTISVRF